MAERAKKRYRFNDDFEEPTCTEAEEIAHKKKISVAIAELDNRQLVDLLADTTVTFQYQSYHVEFSDIMKRFFEPDDWIWKYRPKRRAALLDTFRILCNDRRFPICDHVQSICGDHRQLVDILEVIFSQDSCPAELYDQLHVSVDLVIRNGYDKLLHFMCNLDKFNVNRIGGDGGWYHQSRRPLHTALVDSVEKSFSSELVSILLSHPKTDPNLRSPYSGRWLTPVCATDESYRNSGTPTTSPHETDGGKQAADNMFLLLSHDDVDIHTIGENPQRVRHPQNLAYQNGMEWNWG